MRGAHNDAIRPQLATGTYLCDFSGRQVLRLKEFIDHLRLKA